MIYLVCIFAILAILISLILIDMGISERDKMSMGIGLFVLAVVFVVGGYFWVGVKTPLVIVNLIIGLPICYNACKGMASCSKGGYCSVSDKIIGSAFWGLSMIFLAIAFYYWYYIPEYKLLTVAMSIIAVVAFVHAIYCLFTRRSNFLSALTALVFAFIVFYYGDVRGILPLTQKLQYLTVGIIITTGIRFVIGFVCGFNRIQKPLED